MAAPPEDTIGAYPGVERSEDDGAIARAAIDTPPVPGAHGLRPSEADIRTRAYLRYLERGGSDGTDFEDWLAAERELKGPKSEV